MAATNKEEWWVDLTPEDKGYHIAIGGGETEGESIAFVFFSNSKKTTLANAHLIVAAVNACRQINPDNPMAAAEGITNLYKAVESLLYMAKNAPYSLALSSNLDMLENSNS